jgi:hypothetical protein
MLCLQWSLVHQALHVPPEKEIQWSQVRGARMPGYWFQDDDAPAHCTKVVREYLDETFGDRWIGREGPITEEADSSGEAADLYSQGGRFESRPKHGLS